MRIWFGSFSLLQAGGCELGEPETVEFAGVPLSMGPRVVLQPSFATTTGDLRKKTGPGVKVSSRRLAWLLSRKTTGFG